MTPLQGWNEPYAPSFCVSNSFQDSNFESLQHRQNSLWDHCNCLGRLLAPWWPYFLSHSRHQYTVNPVEWKGEFFQTVDCSQTHYSLASYTDCAGGMAVSVTLVCVCVYQSIKRTFGQNDCMRGERRRYGNAQACNVDRYHNYYSPILNII